MQVRDEFDVLHIKKLPSFEGLTPRYTELLLQYLTVPYLRVPLVLSLFADPVCIVVHPIACLPTQTHTNTTTHKHTRTQMCPSFLLFARLRVCIVVLICLSTLIL